MKEQAVAISRDNMQIGRKITVTEKYQDLGKEQVEK